MKIYVDQIPETGLKVTETYQPSALDLDRTDVKFTEPIDLSAQVTKIVNNIFVKAKIKATMHLNCSRCVEEFILPLSKECNLSLSVKNEELIDITDNLREEIILSYPLKPLCQPDCKGLCANCGQNLNKGTCGCNR